MDTKLLHSVRILRVTGTRQERARQHGEFVHGLSSAERAELAFTPLSKKNQTLIKRATEHLPGVGRTLARAFTKPLCSAGFLSCRRFIAID